MQEPELSVIIPVMNIENRICDVLNTLKEDTKDFSVEFLIIDRGSKDKTMQMALPLFTAESIKWLCHAGKRWKC